MKFEVISRFIDKNTQKLYEVGSYYETDSQERANEIKKAGYLGERVENEFEKILAQNVTDIVTAVTDGFSSEQLENLLALETAGENRKGVKKHLESLIKGEKDESGAV